MMQHLLESFNKLVLNGEQEIRPGFPLSSTEFFIMCSRYYVLFSRRAFAINFRLSFRFLSTHLPLKKFSDYAFVRSMLNFERNFEVSRARS